MADHPEPGDAVLVVDVQNDFCGGALPVPDGDAVVPVINALIDQARTAGVPVVATRDWHPPDHCSFEPRGGPWPVHCVQGTPGAAFHRGLLLPTDTVIISKGRDPNREAYSGFEGTDLALRLRAGGVRRLWIVGLAQEICVRATALDALSAGFEVRVPLDATRPVDAERGARAVEEMREAGAVVTEGGA